MPFLAAQVLWSVPEVRRRYVDCSEALFRTAPADPSSDLPTQLAKVGVALTQGRTGHVAPAPAGAPAAMDIDGKGPASGVVGGWAGGGRGGG